MESDITTDGVYKLIKRGKLAVIRRSERGMRVSRIALDAYQRRLHDDMATSTLPPEQHIELAELQAVFENDTGLTPREWERKWKAQEIEDSAENMRLTIRALTLQLAKQQRTAARHRTTRKTRKTIHAR